MRTIFIVLLPLPVHCQAKVLSGHDLLFTKIYSFGIRRVSNNEADLAIGGLLLFAPVSRSN